MSLEEVAIDWMKVGMIEDERGFTKQQILLIAVSKEQINSYRNIFKLAGLQLKALEIENLALIRALISPGSPPTLIVDIGGRSTNIVIFDKNSLKHSAQTDFAGGFLTQAISKGLNISSRRAEELKKQKASQKISELKQVQISAREAKNDLETKVRKIEEFLAEGNKVEIMLTLRGREKYNRTWAFQKLNEFLKMIPAEYKIIMEPRFSGKGIIMQIAKK